jgi:hypothetical protein
MSQELLEKIETFGVTRPRVEFMPMPFAIDGHAFSTNGSICVFIKGVEGLPEATDTQRKLVGALPPITVPLDGSQSVDLTALRKFLGEPDGGGGHATRCNACNGSGKCVCRHNDKHDCDECNGRGTIGGRSYERRYVKILGMYFDGNMLSLPLKHLHGEKGEVAINGECLLAIDGPGWRVMIAKLYGGDHLRDVPEFVMEGVTA